MAIKWKVGELIKNLIEEERSGAQPEAQTPEETSPAPTSAEAEKKPETELAAPQYIDMQGSLLELWKKFNDDELTPGRMPMLDEERLNALHPTKQKFELERLRLAAQLETDAKKRLDEMRHAQERENKALDAICRVYVSKDKLIAWCFAFPPYEGGEELSSAMVGMALEKAGVKVGIDPQGMVSMFQEPRYLRLVPMAFGEPPVEGEDGQITENFPRELTREVVVDEHGIADYRAMNYVQIIKKGSVICDITPPVKGTPGIRLDGKPIPPRSVQMPKVPRGVNTTLSEDGRQLLATMDGHLEYTNGAFHVRPVLEIHGDVDYNTGNIDFIGDVQITGDVRENFSVRATGSITVDGIVERLHERGLELNPKSQMIPLRNGFTFLKWHFILTPTGKVILRAAHGVAAEEKRRLRRMMKQVHAGKASLESVQAHYRGWRAHMEIGNTRELLRGMDKYFAALIAAEDKESEGEP